MFTNVLLLTFLFGFSFGAFPAFPQNSVWFQDISAFPLVQLALPTGQSVVQMMGTSAWVYGGSIL